VKLNRWKITFVLFVLAAGIDSPAQTFTSLFSFDGTDGAIPFLEAPTQGPDGNLYGTTVYGGDITCNPPQGCGTVFRFTKNGKLDTLHVFEGVDGANPAAGLILATDGNLYGTTLVGGDLSCSPPTNGCGTVFRITLAGELTTVHTFELTDGLEPEATLLQGADGNLYGTTIGGGTKGGSGTIFTMSLHGSFTSLYSFCDDPPTCTDGAGPIGSLIQANDGKFYGTTESGGNIVREGCGNGCGTVFRLSPQGEFTTVHRFRYIDGANIWSGLVQASDGKLYGTAQQGGNGWGVLYQVTLPRTVTVFHTFNGTDGCCLLAPLIQATDGDLYGITWQGGPPSYDGTIFKITLNGTLTTLYSFCGYGNCVNDSWPAGSLLQDTNGIFYGVTGYAGTNDDGTLFSLDTGLTPFMSLVRDSGNVGTIEGFLGRGFAGTSSVSFNGAPASFTVKSDTLLTAVVPSGATSGYVTVMTPSGALTSSKQFIVLP
jgi:uncharacterized repeat protein (TIGR03803 family)